METGSHLVGHRRLQNEMFHLQQMKLPKEVTRAFLSLVNIRMDRAKPGLLWKIVNGKKDLGSEGLVWPFHVASHGSSPGDWHVWESLNLLLTYKLAEKVIQLPPPAGMTWWSLQSPRNEALWNQPTDQNNHLPHIMSSRGFCTKSRNIFCTCWLGVRYCETLQLCL